MDIRLSSISVQIDSEQSILFSIDKLFIPFKDRVYIKGASGQGKTTLLHLIAGLFIPQTGSIHIGDTDIVSLSESARCRLRRKTFSIIFQKLNLIDYLTPCENISLSMNKGDTDAKALEALEQVGLRGKEFIRTGALSHGQQQRVAIARAIASNSKIILADEPTSSLDEKNACEVIELLLESCEARTLVLVSHDERIEKYFPKTIQFEEIIR